MTLVSTDARCDLKTWPVTQTRQFSTLWPILSKFQCFWQTLVVKLDWLHELDSCLKYHTFQWIKIIQQCCKLVSVFRLPCSIIIKNWIWIAGRSLWFEAWLKFGKLVGLSVSKTSSLVLGFRIDFAFDRCSLWFENLTSYTNQGIFNSLGYTIKLYSAIIYSTVWYASLLTTFTDFFSGIGF